MTVRIREQPQPRKDSDVVVILVVTAGAWGAVSDRLNGAALARPIPNRTGEPPRFLLEQRRNGEPDGVPPRARYGMSLTVREIQILQYVAAGRSNAEIAAELFLSVETIRTHVKHLLRRLGARDRTHAVHLGHMRGLIHGNLEDGAA